MSWLRVILGGILVAGLCVPVLAGPPEVSIRPLAREDLGALRAEAAMVRLGLFRPVARPGHMLRYPAVVATWEPDIRPVARSEYIPRARWDLRGGDEMWTRAALSALAAHGQPLVETVPRDIAAWCPAYAENGSQERAAFWVGMMSALARYESTYRPEAVGGGGQWFGLLQIYPPTAQHFGCHAQSGAALTDPEANLACAVRIMARTVPRDNAVALFDGRWRGVAADWGPMTDPEKIAEMARWTQEQSYCQPDDALRPRARPAGFNAIREALGTGLQQAGQG